MVQVVTISSLNENTHQWTIRARVSHRSGIRNYDNGRNKGKVFDVIFLDATGEIRAACFNRTTDIFDALLQKGNVVTVSNATLKPGSVPPPPL
jgi:replication factor A1